MSDQERSSLLFIRGGDDPDRVALCGGRRAYTGSTDLPKLLLARVPFDRLIVTPDFVLQAKSVDLSRYRCIANLIAEPERNSRTLDILDAALRDFPGKVLNPPKAVMRNTRDQGAQDLIGIDGLVVPATVRLPAGCGAEARGLLERAGLVAPIILRRADAHGGKIVGCFDSVEELLAAVGPAVDHMATQFVDFGSPDGLYRKFRVFFIGKHVVLRHMLVSDHWNVHAKDRPRFMAGRPSAIAEERALFEKHHNPFPRSVGRVLEAVRTRVPLDFFGMDFGLAADGKVVLFEANAAMCFFPFSANPDFKYLQRCFAPAHLAFSQALGLPQKVRA